jgi:hypothetical protein
MTETLFAACVPPRAVLCPGATMMLKHAFKEWAVICRALAEGRQAIILRKGGIAERGGVFEVEHTRFWLYPTYVHQQRGGVKPEARALLDEAEQGRPRSGIVRLTHFAEVPQVYHIGDLETVLCLQDLHCWSQEMVRARFAYRRPSLYVLPVRVYRAAQAYEVEETPEYAGCKSWVELEQGLPTGRAVPVLPEDVFATLLQTVEQLCSPRG